MSVGGTIIDIVKVHSSRWWVNTMDRGDLNHVAVYCDPQGEPLDVGDSLWWQGGHCYWTPRDRSRQDVPLPKIGDSGVKRRGSGEGSVTMNRDHQTIRDHGFDCAACGHHHQGARFAYICIGCPCTHNEASMGDSTPPATPVESPLLTDVLPPWRATLMETRACAASWEPGVRLLGNVRAGDIVAALDHVLSHPPAVSGEGELERLVEAAEAFRAIALDALACWQVEDETPDDKQKRTRSAQSRTLLRHRLHSANGMLRASTPTPGAPR